VTAEVFAAALLGSRKYRAGEAPAKAWLFGIAKNKLAASRKREALDRSASRMLGIPQFAYSEVAIRQRVSRGLAKLARVGRR